MSAACTLGEAPALAEIACEVRRAIPPEARPLTVVVSGITSTRPLRDPASFGGKLSRLVAGAIGAGAATGTTGTTGTAGTSPRDAGSGQAGTATNRLVLSLTVELRDGEIRVTADLRGKNPSFWDRVRDPSAAPALVVHAFASRRIDAEVAASFPTIPLVVTSIERATLPSRDTVALACGDVDRDGSLDVVVVGRQKILVGRFRRGHFASEREAQWSALSPVAPAPLREPIGAALVLPGGGIRAGVTDRERAVELLPDLLPGKRLDDAVPWPLLGCIGENGAALSSPGPCARGETSPINLADVAEADAVAGGRWATTAGAVVTAAAFRSPRDGSVTLRDSLGHTATAPGVGAALALADVDRDGTVELVTSLDTLDPKADALVVSTWSGTEVRERYRVPIPDGIRALAACPPDGDGPAPLVVASEKELRVVR